MAATELLEREQITAPPLQTEDSGDGNGDHVVPSTPFNDGDDNEVQRGLEAAEQYVNLYGMTQRIVRASRAHRTLEFFAPNPQRRAVGIDSGHLILRGEMPVRLN